MSEWLELAGFMYGDAHDDQGFWYSHQLREIDVLTEQQLYWTPGPKNLPILWQVGHIAHRERTHIGIFLQGLPAQEVIPIEFDVFGPEYTTTSVIKKSIKSIESVFNWCRSVRKESQAFIASLQEEDFHKTQKQFGELTVAHWLFITACHTALHVGRIQLLRAMIEGTKERAC